MNKCVSEGKKYRINKCALSLLGTPEYFEVAKLKTFLHLTSQHVTILLTSDETFLEADLISTF